MLAQILNLMKLTITNPREGATTILSFSFGRDVLWMIMALIVVSSGVLSRLASMLAPPSGAPELTAQFLTSPLLSAIVVLGVLMIMVICTHFVGRGFGGTGEFNESLSLVIWLQAIMLMIQVVQLGVLLISPFLASLIGFGSVALFLWLYVNFVAVLHGFTSIPLVLVGIMVSMFAVGFGLSIIAGLIAALFGMEIGRV
ncbi:MAG: YIP1 family protein [Paracoccaceae bacterium]